MTTTEDTRKPFMAILLADDVRRIVHEAYLNDPRLDLILCEYEGPEIVVTYLWPKRKRTIRERFFAWLAK